MGERHERGWVVGMPVYVVPAERMGRPYEATITAIGRKWITFGNGRMTNRFNAETMKLDGKGYSSPGRVWPSKSEYDESTAINQSWSTLCNLFRNHHKKPDHITEQDIAEIMGKLTAPQDAAS